MKICQNKILNIQIRNVKGWFALSQCPTSCLFLSVTVGCWYNRNDDDDDKKQLCWKHPACFLISYYENRFLQIIHARDLADLLEVFACDWQEMYRLFTVNHFSVSLLFYSLLALRPRSLTHCFTTVFVSAFPSGTHQDRKEASGDGLAVSGNRSAGAGAGEKSDDCMRENQTVVRRMPLEENADVRQMTGQRCHKMCVSAALRDDHSVVCSEWTRTSSQLQGMTPQCKGLWEWGGQLTYDSLLFFMPGKPSLTTLTQNKPQSGPMLLFSCFHVLFCFFDLVRAEDFQAKRRRQVKHA